MGHLHLVYQIQLAISTDRVYLISPTKRTRQGLANYQGHMKYWYDAVFRRSKTSVHNLIFGRQDSQPKNLKICECSSFLIIKEIVF